MSRTLRRGFDKITRTWTDRKRSRHDWSCKNPACCGGKMKTLERRRERARHRQRLLRDPETAPTRPTKGDR